MLGLALQSGIGVQLARRPRSARMPRDVSSADFYRFPPQGRGIWAMPEIGRGTTNARRAGDERSVMPRCSRPYA
jgi:hypothetical protein